MFYRDAMYGQIELPSFIDDLVNTPEVQRLKLISQDVLPQSCLPYKVNSRFDHSMGVCHLAWLAISKNKLSEKDILFLLASALLHDVGNPPLSHLSEPFLKKLTGKDGESFLENMLENSEAGVWVGKAGLNLHDVVQCVTGNFKPLSVLINGSMDVDNLDNIARYWFTAHDGGILYDTQFIASSFQYREDAWTLNHDCLKETQKWQKARQMVYGIIYEEPHLNAGTMVYRAVEIAFYLGEITEDFFRLNDTQAIDFLLTCNKDSAHLVKKVLDQQRYPEFFSFKTISPSDRLQAIAKDRDMRKILAEMICEQYHLPPSAVCVYVGQGRDKRKIDLPFVDKNGSRYLDIKKYPPIYRVKVYVDPECGIKKAMIKSFVEQKIL